MQYRVEYTNRAIKQLSKLDKPVKKMIKSWIEKNLIGTENPRLHGKGLTANRSGQWRYRIGDYRLICEINDNELIIVAVDVGHRSRIYK